jgi:hypothetical protein
MFRPLKKLSTKAKYTPKQAVRKAKIAEITSITHNKAAAGWV